MSPTVGVVLVARDPGPGFDEVLAGLAAQDHRDLRILVIDTGRESVADQVVDVLPDARVIAGHHSLTFGSAANLVLKEMGAHPAGSFHLFLRDDLVLAGTAARRMVEAAVEANAGIVGSKVLAGEHSICLDDMGATVDRLGSPVSRVEPGEIDQGQHDGRHEVFATSEAALMIRGDLFEAIGGFDSEIRSPDGHVDLCWRARLAGASVLLAPNAVGRRPRAPASRSRPIHPDILGPRHRLRMTLSNRSAPALIPILVESMFATLLGVAYALLAGRFRFAAGHLSAWGWNLKRLGGVRAMRRRTAALRVAAVGPFPAALVPYHALRRAVIGRAPHGTGDQAPARVRFHQLWGALLGPGGISLMVSAAVLGFGSRHLLTRGLPAIGRFQSMPSNPLDLVSSWWHGWRPTGTGVSTTGPDGLPLVGLLAYLVPGSDQLLWTAVILAALPVGALGVWRLARPVGGGRSRAVAVLVYLSVPLPYDALREGRITPLAAYAVLPWVASRLAIAHGFAPYGPIGGDPGPATRHRRLWAEIPAMGLVLAAAIALDPVLVVPVSAVFAGLVVGSLATGSVAGLGRLLGAVLGGVLVAAILHLPLIIELLDGRPLASFAGPSTWPIGDLGAGGLFRLDTGGFRADDFGWVVLVVPALALVAAAGRHLALGIRTWFVVAAGLAATWAADQGWWSGRVPAAETLLVPAALGLAWAAAVATAAIGTDLSGRVVLWRRLLAPIAGIALIASIVPVFAGSIDGAWQTPREDLRGTVAFLVETRAPIGTITRGGDDRVVWIGEQSLLPAIGVPLTDHVAIAVTDGWPDLLDQWSYPLAHSPGVIEIRNSLGRALIGKTNRLGAQIGLWGVTHLVLVERSAPAPGGAQEVPLPTFYSAALTRQLDLTRVEGLNRAVTIFANTAHQPVQAVVRDSNRRAVPVASTLLDWDRRMLRSTADGALRWTLGPPSAWALAVPGSDPPLLAPGAEGGISDSPSVRVARGTTAYLTLDGSTSHARRRLQIALLIVTLLAANWVRARPDREYR
ncbi:MAG: hypothetical protein VX833_01745 [Actinomycetota bacterium]|nr:hypothetical protein [Actinomycetota bacterium]